MCLQRQDGVTQGSEVCLGFIADWQIASINVCLHGCTGMESCTKTLITCANDTAGATLYLSKYRSWGTSCSCLAFSPCCSVWACNVCVVAFHIMAVHAATLEHKNVHILDTDITAALHAACGHARARKRAQTPSHAVGQANILLRSMNA